jgi:nitrite reductase/ring-hydroxylating ferredoxin subunit/uncharacterized membrane protein
LVGRALDRLIDAQTRWAKPLGDWLHGLADGIFGRMVPVRSLLNGTWLGHPVHSALTDVPIGALGLVIVFDLVGRPTAADIALVVGVLAMLASAVVGYADYSVTDGTARTRATVHSMLMVIALVIYLGSAALRAAGPTDRTAAVVLSVVAFAIVAAGAYVGGDVVFVLGNMVDRHAWRPTGAKWQPLDVGDIPEGTPVKAKVGLQNLVLVRQGDTIHALHEQCAHAGGPLSGGRIVDGCIECPWHQSRFELATGRRRRGPTVYDQPAYEVRPADGGGYEVRRRS